MAIIIVLRKLEDIFNTALRRIKKSENSVLYMFKIDSIDFRRFSAYYIEKVMGRISMKEIIDIIALSLGSISYNVRPYPQVSPDVPNEYV